MKRERKSHNAGEEKLRPHPALPEALNLPILFRDEHLVVVSKPSGMATHPGPGWWRGSCVNGLLHAIGNWPGIKGVAGPGIVHRLDRDTSGLLVFALTEKSHRALLKSVAEREFERVYIACLEGNWPLPACVRAPLGRDELQRQRVVVRSDGKTAISFFEPVFWEPSRTWVHVRLETGRTHQIRVHASHAGHPVVGDPVYGNQGPVMALHAWKLGFEHPQTGEWLMFCEPPPPTWHDGGLTLPEEVLRPHVRLE